MEYIAVHFSQRCREVDFFECLTERECAVLNSCNTLGEVDSADRKLSEGGGSNRTNTDRHTDFCILNIRVYKDICAGDRKRFGAAREPRRIGECVHTDICDRFRDRNIGQHTAVRECIVADREDAVGDNCRSQSAAFECTRADPVDALGNGAVSIGADQEPADDIVSRGHAEQRGIGKGIAGNFENTVGDIGFAQTAASEEGILLDIFRAIRDDEGSEGRTAAAYTVRDMVNLRGEAELGERHTFTQRLVFEPFHRIGHIESSETRTAMERIFLDCLHALGKNDLGDRTVTECKSADPFQRRGEIDALEVAAAVEGIISDFDDAFGDDNRNELFILFKGVVADAENALGNHDVADIRFLCIFFEDTVFDIEGRIDAAQQCRFLFGIAHNAVFLCEHISDTSGCGCNDADIEIRAERIRMELCHRGRNNHGFQLGTAGECILTDFRNSFGDENLFELAASGKGFPSD